MQRQRVTTALVVAVLLVATALALAGPAAAPGTVRVAYLQRILSLDPHGSSGAARVTWIVGRHLFNRLVAWDPQAKQFQPELALRWQNPTPTTWEFELRRGVKFHDGTDFTSAAVKASIERVIGMRGPLAPLFSPVETVETQDPYRVVIRTREPMGTLMSNLTILSIVPAGTPMTEIVDRAIGTGPFKFAEFVRDTRVVLDANPNYWRQGTPKMQRLIFVDIPEISTRATALETGEIDMAVGLPPEEIKRLRGNSALKVDIGPTTLTRIMWINPRPGSPLANVQVRRALSHAININAITASLVAGIASPATSSIATNVLCYAKMKPNEYSTTLARRMLAEAGYPKGFETTLKWTESNPKEREIADAIAGQFALVGVRVQNTQQTFAIWLDDLLKLNWDLELVSTGGGTGDPDFTLRRLYHSRAKRTLYTNAEIDRLTDEAATTVELSKRCDLYRRAQEILWNDVAAVYLFDQLEAYAYRTRIQGFKTPATEIFDLSEATVSP
jgi:peptide/nickel transport system substrate-binding protein